MDRPDQIRRLLHPMVDGNRGSLDLRTSNEIGDQILDIKLSRSHEDIEDILANHFGGERPAEDSYEEEYESDIREKVEDLAELIEEEGLSSLDVDEWLDAIKEIVVDHMSDNDDSTVRDMLNSFDRCEVAFIFKRPGHSLDRMISSHQPWSDPAEISMDAELQFVLSRLGYTISEFREITGNKHPSDQLVPGLRKRAERLIDPDQFERNHQRVLRPIFPCLHLRDRPHRGSHRSRYHQTDHVQSLPGSDL